jgi:hypothetical protein
MNQEQGDVMDCDGIRDDMLDVLYGEGGEAAARRVEAHHAVCADCRNELASLRRLRTELSQWSLPEILQGGTSTAAAPSRRWLAGLAAAAGVILALGAALGFSGGEVRYDHAGLYVRIGRSDTREAAAAEERARLRAEIAALRAEIAARPASDDRPTLATVAAMIHESEARQDGVRAASLRAIRQRADTQRQYDLARVSAGMAYLDGKAGLQAARTTELMGHLLQASQK